VHRDLAAQQVEAVDAVRALVNVVQAIVAIESLDGKITRVAVPTVNLDRQLVGLEAELRGPGFRDRREQVFALLVALVRRDRGGCRGRRKFARCAAELRRAAR